ncbi:hypothetical protein [Thermococcus stetteri]|uniref:hypothetical protein n=1 Tax=Thermococcus stetteri TaxID=49900 RepID=UPI001AE6895D|nr:hypothetical protein [Thermococcus stetteri]
MKDSVEAVLELDERSVYSHIAHESAEDIIRIISSIDAERAKLRGEVIYYADDWDDLIRQRIAKGKRHTAFDFYNPTLLDIWEAKVKEIKKLKHIEAAAFGIYVATLAFSVIALFTYGVPVLPIVLGLGPILLFAKQKIKERIDLSYYELTQFFIDELSELINRYNLNPENYKFRIFTAGYFGIGTKKTPSGVFAYIQHDSG